MNDDGRPIGLAEPAPPRSGTSLPSSGGRWPRHELFRGLRARARTGILIEGAAVLAAALAGFVLASYTVDRWLQLETLFRALLLAGFVWLAARIAARRLRTPLAVQLDDDELALAVERREPGLAQSLISAVEFDRDLERATTHGQSETMMRQAWATKSKSIWKKRAACGREPVVKPRAVTGSVTCQPWLTGGASASRILPTICDHICIVARVSRHSAYGSAGHALSWSAAPRSLVTSVVFMGLLPGGPRASVGCAMTGRSRCRRRPLVDE